MRTTDRVLLKRPTYPMAAPAPILAHEARKSRPPRRRHPTSADKSAWSRPKSGKGREPLASRPRRGAAQPSRPSVGRAGHRIDPHRTHGSPPLTPSSNTVLLPTDPRSKTRLCVAADQFRLGDVRAKARAHARGGIRDRGPFAEGRGPHVLVIEATDRRGGDVMTQMGRSASRRPQLKTVTAMIAIASAISTQTTAHTVTKYHPSGDGLIPAKRVDEPRSFPRVTTARRISLRYE